MKLKPSPAAIIAIVALAVFTVFITWRAKSLERAMHERGESSPLVNKAAPPFALPSLDGRTVSLADFHGKQNLVVSFWASWCGPCRLEMPVLRAFYEKHHNDSSGFEFLAISIDDGAAPARAFATSSKIPFPVLLDISKETAEAYDVDGIPTLFVIDKSGKVIFGRTGYDAALQFQLANALGIDLVPNGGAAHGASSN
jgi:peroxiredoxin